MQSTGDGHRQPLTDGLSIALIEQVSGGAALALEVMKHRLGDQDRTRTNSTICRSNKIAALKNALNIYITSTDQVIHKVYLH